MWLITSLMVLAVFGQNANEGETLFREMGKKLAAAKTVQLSCETIISEAKDGDELMKEMKKMDDWGVLVLNDEGRKFLRRTIEIKGRIALATGDKAFVTSDWTLLEKSALLDMSKHKIPLSSKTMLVSDGTRMVAKLFDDKPIYRETPKGLSRLSVEDLYLWGMVNVGRDDSSPLPGKRVDLKLVRKEKVGQHVAHLLQYRVVGEGFELWVALWLDADTQLPVKRELFLPPGMLRSDTYSDLRLDGQVDPTIFQVPEEKK